MRRGEFISITVAGLMSGLLSVVPAGLAEDRDGLPRVETAEGTFIAIDVSGGTFTPALGINSAGKIVGEYVSVRDGNTHGFLRTAMASTPR